MRGVREPRTPTQTWATFLANHASTTWACDFVQTFDAAFRPIFAFFIVNHGSREVVHFNVPRSATDAWVARQLRDATPSGEAPKFLIRDNDDKYGRSFAAVAEGAGIRVIRTAYRAPLMNSICERFLGSLRRECLDDVLVLSENHMRCVVREDCEYFKDVRPHQSLGQRTPSAVAAGNVATVDRDNEAAKKGGEVVSIPVLGGLHHKYRWAA